MKEIFDYQGIDRDEFQEAVENIGTNRFMALSMLATAEMIEERAEELMKEAEEAREEAKEMLKEEVDHS